MGHVRSPKKFGPDQFRRFDVCWIKRQTNRQIPADPLTLLYSNLLYSELSVDVLLGYPLCKDSNPRFTTVPFKLYYDKKCERYCRYSDSKSGFFLCLSQLFLIC